MKRTEIAMIVLISSLSMFATFTIAQKFLANSVKRTVTIEQAKPISKEIAKPSKRIFNSDAINPTIEVCVESNSVDSGTSNDNCQMSTSAATSSEQSQSTNQSAG